MLKYKDGPQGMRSVTGIGADGLSLKFREDIRVKDALTFEKARM